MKALLFFGSLLVTCSAFAQPVPCKQAMDTELRKYEGATNTIQYLNMQITPIGDEQLFEVTSLVLTDNPKSDALSAYYWLVSATCKAKSTASSGSEIKNLILSEDMPGEGGVVAKMITKMRF